MGWHYILKFKCKLLPEYIKFIEKKYLSSQTEATEHHIFGVDNYDYIYNKWYHRNRDKYADLEKEEIIAIRKKEIDDAVKEAQEKRYAEYNGLTSKYKELVDIWNSLNIEDRFYGYELEGNIFSCEISKKVHDHEGDLELAYLEFMHSIIVPITSEINECVIISDDVWDFEHHYSDAQLRSRPFSVTDKICSVQHTYNSDRTTIIESRVVYKYPINVLRELDLNRHFGVDKI
jgi:hypothetical protein